MLLIREIDRHNVTRVNQSDGRFIVEAKLDLRAENGQIGYTIISVLPVSMGSRKSALDHLRERIWRNVR